MADLIRFEKNVPQVIALQFAEGKVVQSTIPNSPDSVMFSLSTPPGARTFLPISAAEMIKRAGIAARTPFEICKVGKDDYRIRELRGAGAASTAPAPVGTNGNSNTSYTGPHHNPDHAYRDSAPNSANHPEARAPQALPGTPITTAHAKFLSAYMVAIDIITEVKVYASRKNLPIDVVTFGDVRALAATIVIDNQQNGGAR